jgi:hypothetical protein
MLPALGVLSISTVKVDGTSVIKYVVSYNPFSLAQSVKDTARLTSRVDSFLIVDDRLLLLVLPDFPFLALIPSEPVAPLLAAAAILLAPVWGTTAGILVPEPAVGCNPPVPVVVLVPELDAELVVKLLTLPYCGGLLV